MIYVLFAIAILMLVVMLAKRSLNEFLFACYLWALFLGFFAIGWFVILILGRLLRV